MCGIAGFFRINSRHAEAEDESRLHAQIATFGYRGPDSRDVYAGSGMGLAHARLAILDLSAAAAQPMASASGRTILALNGEIYNFRDLRCMLESEGHRFRTNSDTEVVLEGYEAWGLEMVHRLRGMFAIALLDLAGDRLVLFRDRVGKKPLYYSVQQGTLLFASEIKGILRWPGVPREPNLRAIDEYLTYQYVPAPLTGFEGIHKLLPGHMLMQERGREHRTERYFRLPAPAAAKERPVEQLCEELRHHLKEATRLRMIADVPVGIFLSGGVDSSSVVAMMAELSGTPVRTFTIGFDSQIYDERKYARMVAERYGTVHEEELFRPDVIPTLQELVYHYGEPYADSSALPTYFVSKLARRSVTVALSGEAGDENFLGYGRYQACRTWERERLVSGVKADGDRVRAYEPHIAYCTGELKQKLYDARIRPLLDSPALDRLRPFFDETPTIMAAAAWADIHTYLPDDLLVKMDVAGMAHSLEVRCPFADQELMAWASTIPEEQKAPGGELKRLLKTAMADYLPPEIVDRRKRGFMVPIEDWLAGELKEFSRATLLCRAARERGLFDLKFVESALDAYTPQRRAAKTLWALLMLELWFQMWIDTEDCFRDAVAERIVARVAC